MLSICYHYTLGGFFHVRLVKRRRRNEPFSLPLLSSHFFSFFMENITAMIDATSVSLQAAAAEAANQAKASALAT
ncbi:unnamed protein product [Citrullus colocynthis]|uniref:Uncharacterized protein n=1 Tax=Citrullus colocynthis TaxID=252529 RepID=A0ABP0Z0M7_9ROSI